MHTDRGITCPSTTIWGGGGAPLSSPGRGVYPILARLPHPLGLDGGTPLLGRMGYPPPIGKDEGIPPPRLRLGPGQETPSPEPLVLRTRSVIRNELHTTQKVTVDLTLG